MEDVEEITGKAVYIAEDSLPEMSLEEDGFAALVGWMVVTVEMPDQVGHDDEVGMPEDEMPDQVGHDEEVGHDDEVGHDEEEEMSLPELTGNLYEVGEITDFMDIPNNPCIEVETENGAVILPLHEDLILSIDPENQEIIMQIPAGLI